MTCFGSSSEPSGPCLSAVQYGRDYMFHVLAVGIVAPFVIRMVAIFVVNEEGERNMFLVKCNNSNLVFL